MRVPLSEQTAQQGEDLAQWHFSRIGFTVRPQNNRDYGLDHHAELIEDEQASGRLLALQVKTGDSYFAEQDGTHIIFRTDSDHRDYWLNHSLPVVVCLCDLAESEVYWQIVSPETIVSTGKGFKIRVPIDQKVDEQSTLFARLRTDSDHRDYWLNHSLPVVVCLCDLAASPRSTGRSSALKQS